MTKNPYPIGTLLKLVSGTYFWGQERLAGRSDFIFEVVAHIEDGTSLKRISVRPLGTSEPPSAGRYVDLYERV